MSISSVLKTHKEFDKRKHSYRQVEDCLEGSARIKKQNELYLPMPSSMLEVEVSNSGLNADFNFEKSEIPWWHNNPAYRAYLMRARFPDITAIAKRKMVGVSCKKKPVIELPNHLEYLLDLCTADGDDIFSLYELIVGELIANGKVSLLVDINKANNNCFFTIYPAITNTNWETSIDSGERKLTESVFYLGEKDGDDEFLHLFSGVNNSASWAKFSGDDEKLVDGGVYSKQGSTLSEIPVVNIGLYGNSPKPSELPLLGISDIALTIYRENADAASSRFQTCNPTLFITGESEAPKFLGSNIVVTLPNPEAKAFYPKTDTSALDHIQSTINDLFNEASQYGSSFFAQQGNQKESGEAMSLRKSDDGVSLVQICSQAARGLEAALEIANKYHGSSDTGAVVVDANLDFSEKESSPQDKTAMATLWSLKGIPHADLLYYLRSVGALRADRTDEDILKDLQNEIPVL